VKRSHNAAPAQYTRHLTLTSGSTSSDSEMEHDI